MLLCHEYIRQMQLNVRYTNAIESLISHINFITRNTIIINYFYYIAGELMYGINSLITNSVKTFKKRLM